MSRRILLLLFIFSVGYTAPNYWPTDEWKYSTPEKQGMDSETLVKLIDYIKENELNIHSVTIIRHGYIVFDAYFWPMEPDDLHDIASCTKSVTSTLIGVAQDQGYLDINQPMLDFFPDRTVANLDDDKESITIRNLLTMTTGMECVNQPTEVTLMEMQRSPDFIQYALDLPMTNEPGSKWIYNSCASHLLGGIVANTFGMSLEQFARVNLFDPIGVDSVYWPRDPQGYNHGWGDLQMTPHDMAKIGFLMLNKGRWDGRQIVSRRWVRQATRNYTRNFGPEDGYGYQWWTYKYGSFQAVGRGGQRIFVLPVLDLIVVVTAGVSAEETAHYETVLASFIIPAVKKRNSPLAPNSDGAAALQAKIEEISQSPAPQPIPEMPALAQAVSGKTWTIGSNLIGWQKIRFDFTDKELLIILTIEGEDFEFPVGLDGVPRISTGARFAANDRYRNQNVALHGWWEADTFVLGFNTLAVIDNGTIRFRFDGDELKFTLFERSLMPVDQVFTGTLEEER